MLKIIIITILLILPITANAMPIYTSWYGGGERYIQSHTANGERFNPNDRTAASRTLPFGTRLLVTYRGRHTTVRVNDRGPAAWTGRSLDLSRQAAIDIGLNGCAVVDIQIIR